MVDLFAGSGNTLYWLMRDLGPRRGVGFELDEVVFGLTRRNLSVMSLGIDLVQTSYDRGLRALTVAGDELLIVFVAPPWGRALDASSGLDLRRTLPPIAEVIDQRMAVFEDRRVLFAIQLHETVDPDSLTEVTTRFHRSAVRVYDINAPGQNHGLPLGSCGWTA